MFDSLGDQGSGGFGPIELAGDGMADGRTAFFCQSFSLRARGPVTERHFGACRSEHSDRGRANAARAAGNQSHLARE
jgi:hypothetical protein